MLFDILNTLKSGNSIDFLSFAVGIISSLVVIFITMPVHEAAHAFTADRLGDHTARYQGRLSLNPMKHIDPIGAVFIILFGFGWAKPVPVNGYGLKKPKRDMALIALAGPLTNLLMAFIMLLIRNILFMIVFSVFSVNNTVLYIIIATLFDMIAEINVSLAVFNLIPIPPLDGSRLISAVLPEKLYYNLMRYEQYFYFALVAIIFLGVLDTPLYFITNYAYSGINRLAGLPFGFVF